MINDETRAHPAPLLRRAMEDRHHRCRPRPAPRTGGVGRRVGAFAMPAFADRGPSSSRSARHRRAQGSIPEAETASTRRTPPPRTFSPVRSLATAATSTAPRVACCECSTSRAPPRSSPCWLKPTAAAPSRRTRSRTSSKRVPCGGRPDPWAARSSRARRRRRREVVGLHSLPPVVTQSRLAQHTPH